MVFVGMFVLVALVDYIEMMRRAGDIPNVSGVAGRQDLVLPRAAGHRAHPAVLRADRRDGLLPQSVAAARIGGRARGRHVGLAVHFTGADRGVRDRRLRHRRLQPGCCRAAASSPKRWRPSCSARTTGFGCAGGTLLGQASATTKGQSIINAKASRDQGVSLDRGHRLHLRQQQPFHRAHRGARGRARARRTGG